MGTVPTANEYRRNFRKSSASADPITQSPLDSKGILGGLLASGGFGILAIVLSRATGVAISGDELRDTVDQGKEVIDLLPVWIGIVGTMLGLIGNWKRQAAIAWTGEGNQRPWKSRGIVGNAIAAGAAVWAFVQGIALDAPKLAAIWGDVTAQWQITAPAVLALVGTLGGLYGRWRAKAPILSEPLPVSGEHQADDEWRDFAGYGGITLPAAKQDRADLVDRADQTDLAQNDNPSDVPVGPVAFDPRDSLRNAIAWLLLPLVALGLSSCATAVDENGEPLSGPVIQAGIVGAGVAVEVTDREGNGAGFILSLYPVNPNWSRLGKAW